MNDKSIVCISTHFWDDFWFRKQHFMSRFAEEGYRILYVQPSHSMLREYRKPELANNRMLLPVIKRATDRITLLSPPKLLPKPAEPFSRKISCAYHSLLIARAVRRLGFEQSILWIYRPQYALSLKMIPHSKLVFDLADDLSSYGRKQTRGSKYVAHCTKMLATEADLMIVTSPTLFKMYEASAKKCVVVPNGFDENLFDGSRHSLPEDLEKIKSPIAGFVGTLFSFIDYDLLYRTAKELTNVSFVFVGPVEKSGEEGVKLINQLNNVYLLGPKPKSAIPQYVSNFNICLNPFKVDNVSKAVSPLKVYEYLATGRPVVSTPMAGLENESASKLVRFAKPYDFTFTITKLLESNEVHEVNKEQIKASQSYSWSSRFKALRSYMEEL